MTVEILFDKSGVGLFWSLLSDWVETSVSPAFLRSQSQELDCESQCWDVSESS